MGKWSIYLAARLVLNQPMRIFTPDLIHSPQLRTKCSTLKRDSCSVWIISEPGSASINHNSSKREIKRNPPMVTLRIRRDSFPSTSLRSVSLFRIALSIFLEMSERATGWTLFFPWQSWFFSTFLWSRTYCRQERISLSRTGIFPKLILMGPNNRYWALLNKFSISIWRKVLNMNSNH